MTFNKEKHENCWLFKTDFFPPLISFHECENRTHREMMLTGFRFYWSFFLRVHSTNAFWSKNSDKRISHLMFSSTRGKQAELICENFVTMILINYARVENTNGKRFRDGVLVRDSTAYTDMSTPFGFTNASWVEGSINHQSDSQKVFN